MSSDKSSSQDLVVNFICFFFSQEDGTPSTSHDMSVRGNVLNRVGHQQDKWKRQVREQRRNIYDRHAMLN